MYNTPRSPMGHRFGTAQRTLHWSWHCTSGLQRNVPITNTMRYSIRSLPERPDTRLLLVIKRPPCRLQTADDVAGADLAFGQGGTRHRLRLLRWGIYWGPRHSARGHCGIIARWVCAVVPYWRGDWRHLNIGSGDNPERRYVKEYSATEVINVSKSMGHDKRMVAK